LVPDAGLHGLPFAALREHADAAPLGARFALTTAPSISLWLRVKTPRRDASDAALVLADPPPLPAGALSMDEPLGPLPMARDEARIFVERLAPDAESRLGSDASEAFVKQGGLRARGVIHLAAHALLDEEHPERAAVVLAGGADEEDGLLQMREITRLDVPGALVVLASCRSASGTVIGAEGPIGLSRAFFVAGARTVVASLWRIRDDEAAAFFEAFYRHLAEGRTVADAVRAAQVDRQRAGAPAAGWAGFVVLGDGDLAPVPTRPSSRWWWLLPLPFLFAGVGLLIANRESARPRAP